MRVTSNVLCLVFLALISAGTVPAALPDSAHDLWRYIHPGAKAVVGVDWTAVQRSAVGQWVERRWLNGESMPGIEFLPSVEEVLLSSPGRVEGDSGDPPVLIAVRGSFDLAKVRQTLVRHGRKPQPFGDVTIYKPAKTASSDPSFALVSSEVVLIGDTHSLFSALERARIEDRQSSPDGLLARAQVLASQYDCWAVLSEPGAMRNFFFASLANASLSRDSESFQAGISVKDGLAMDVIFQQRTEVGARLLQASLNRGIRLAAAGNPEGAGAWEVFLGQLRIGADHSNVLMSLRMTPSEVDAALRGKPAPAVAKAANAPDQSKPMAPVRRVVRIEGLDDGVREVVLK